LLSVRSFLDYADLEDITMISFWRLSAFCKVNVDQ